LVHGTAHSAWCYYKFQQELASAGYPSLAISLRGHGNSEGMVLQCTLDDYLTDVMSALQELQEPYYLVGHSLGGMLVQKVVQLPRGGTAIQRPRGLMILSALIPQVMWRLYFHPTTWRHPIGALRALRSEDYRTALSTSQHVRDAFFTSRTPPEIVEECWRHLREQPESMAALVALFRQPPFHPLEGRLPVFVACGTADGTTPISLVTRTASFYGVDLHFYAGMGHDLMLDENPERGSSWKNVVEEMVQ
jgi:pimeloyl-ACP methyl ester carboxylesterase